jgi:hypothetical protein
MVVEVAYDETMVFGSVCLALIGAQQMTAQEDMNCALTLWRAFGKPLMKSMTEMNRDPSHRNRHFHVGERLSNALPFADDGNYPEAMRVLREKSYDSPAPWLGVPVNGSLEAETAFYVYGQLVDQYLDMAPAGRILSQLEDLNRRKLIGRASPGFSARGKGRGLDDFIADLKVTIRLSGAKAGTVQAAVENLENLQVSGFEPSGRRGFPIMPPQYRQVMAFGLDAIEPLVKEMDGTKLTRTFLGGVMMRQSQVMPVRYFAEDLILKIAKGDLGDQEDGPLPKALVLKWLEVKRKGKVEEWLMANLVMRDSEIGNYPNYRSFNALVKAHPHLLNKAIKVARAAKIEDVWIDRALLMPGMDEKQRKALLRGI